MRVKGFQLAAVVLCGVLSTGCTGGTADVEGGVLNIGGLPGDRIHVQRSPTVPDSLLCCSTADGCRGTAVVAMDENGMGRVTRLVVPSGYVIFSNETGCFDISPQLPCRGVDQLFCFPPVQPVASLGTITVEGGGVDCVPVGGRREICNNGWVKITINGIQVSSRILPSSTASSVASDLATKINSHPDLGPIVGATVSGPSVTVFSRTAGVEYSYPWQASCTYAQTYFSQCPYRAKLAPIATLAPE